MIVYTVIDCFIIIGVIFLLNEKMQKHIFKKKIDIISRKYYIYQSRLYTINRYLLHVSYFRQFFYSEIS